MLRYANAELLFPVASMLMLGSAYQAAVKCMVSQHSHQGMVTQQQERM
jgi:hypothetical protein